MKNKTIDIIKYIIEKHTDLFKRNYNKYLVEACRHNNNLNIIKYLVSLNDEGLNAYMQRRILGESFMNMYVISGYIADICDSNIVKETMSIKHDTSHAKL